MSETFLQKMVLAEIEGKNRAIHAYDGIMWKIRSGFLTLLFGGWAVLLKGIVEARSQHLEQYSGLAVVLLLFSGGFAFGAWRIDSSYQRRKFRVISALNGLIEELSKSQGDPSKLSTKFLKVAGENAEIFFDTGGYRQAKWTEFAVYLAPCLILIVGVGLIFSPWHL